GGNIGEARSSYEVGELVGRRRIACHRHGSLISRSCARATRPRPPSWDRPSVDGTPLLGRLVGLRAALRPVIRLRPRASSCDGAKAAITRRGSPPPGSGSPSRLGF